MVSGGIVDLRERLHRPPKLGSRQTRRRGSRPRLSGAVRRPPPVAPAGVWPSPNRSRVPRSRASPFSPARGRESLRVALCLGQQTAKEIARIRVAAAFFRMDLSTLASSKLTGRAYPVCQPTPCSWRPIGGCSHRRIPPSSIKELQTALSDGVVALEIRKRSARVQA